jgi:hypothetical protein
VHVGQFLDNQVCWKHQLHCENSYEEVFLRSLFGVMENAIERGLAQA